MLDREILLAKLKALLDKSLTKQEIYEWALSQAVTEDYERFIREDPLLSAVMQTFMNLSGRQELPEKAWEYYRQCLLGEREFRAAALSKLGGEKAPHIAPQPVGKTVLVLRVYILIFAVCILGLHLLSLFKPELLFMEIPASRTEALKESLPQIIYACILLLPLRIMVSGFSLLVSLPAVLFGVYYYLRIAFEIIDKFSLEPLFFVVLLPFGALPAILALGLHFWAWKKYKS